MEISSLPSWMSAVRCGEQLPQLHEREILPCLYIQEITIGTTAKDIKDGKEDLPPLRNPLLGTADDLATLSHCSNEPSGRRLSAPFPPPGPPIRQFSITCGSESPCPAQYLHIGIVLIGVNPFQRVTLYGPGVIQTYSGRKRGELEPHLFAIPEYACTPMTKAHSRTAVPERPNQPGSSYDTSPP